MKQLIICLCVLIIAASCEFTSSSGSSQGTLKPAGEPSQANTSSNDSITVFFTGSMLGKLKPCGCSGGQLGGLDRRPAIFDAVPKDKRLLIDTGSLVENKLSEQDFLKFYIIIESLKYLHYNVVNMTQQDLKMARQYGPLDTNSVGFISSYQSDDDLPPGNQHEFQLDGQKVTVSAVGFDPNEMPVEFIKNFFPAKKGQKSLNILILNNYSDEIISEISQLGIVDCLVCPIKSDEPTVISKRGEKPLVYGVGRFGRHIGKLVIKNAPDGGFKMNFEDIPVTEDIVQDEYLVGLYKLYQSMVKDSGILEKNLRFPPPDGLKYVGSKTCSSIDCHFFEYTMWSKQNLHSHAYATLEEVGSQYDPECIKCHVVGYDYESGFISAEKTPQLENVGCEYCHGPGSAHNKNPYENKMTVIQDKVKLCEKCHSPEHSGDFAGQEQEYLQKINHWPEPNDVNNVK